jgi:hypothetical protein
MEMEGNVNVNSIFSHFKIVMFSCLMQWSWCWMEWACRHEQWHIFHRCIVLLFIFSGTVHIYQVYISPYLHYLSRMVMPHLKRVFLSGLVCKTSGPWIMSSLCITVGFWGYHRYPEMQTVNCNNKWNFAFGWWKKPSTWNYCFSLKFSVKNFWARKFQLIETCDWFC